jgi:hypothetical protein
LPNLPTTPQELEILLTSKESSAVKFRDSHVQFSVGIHFARCQS